MPRPPINPIASIVINDGVSAEMKQLKRRFSTAVTGLGDLTASISGTIAENLFSSIKLIGLGALIGGGGVVASIAAITAELSKFAAKGLILKSTVQELNLTLGEFKQLVNIGMAQGLSKEQAEADVIRFAEAVLDLRRGVESDTRRKLEEKSTFGSGTVVARQLQQRLAREGDRPFAIMLDVLRQRRSQARGSDEDRLAAEIWGNAFGIGSPAWNEAIDNIEEFASDSIGPAEEDAKDFLLAQVQLILELENMRNSLAVASIPALEAVTAMLAEWLQPENMEAFKAHLRVWIKAINETDWAGIRQDIDSFRTTGVPGLRKFMNDIGRSLRAAERINAIVTGWHKEQGKWEPGVAVPYLNAPTMAPIVDNPPPPSTDQPVRFTDSTQAPSPTTTRYTISDEYKRWQLQNAEDLSGGYSTNIEDRRDDSPFELRSNIIVKPSSDQEQTEWGGGSLAFESRADLFRFQRDLNEMKREFNDLYDLIDIEQIKFLLGRGYTGGNTEGGVAVKGRTAPSKTKAGGADSPKIYGPPRQPYVPLAPPLAQSQADVARILPYVSPVSRLGLETAQVQTYDELRQSLRSNPLTAPSTIARYEEFMKSAYGFAFSQGDPRNIYYSTNQAAPSTTLAHEGGHVGRQLVQEAGKKDPTLRGYGVSLGQWKEGPKEELAQRFLDLEEAKTLRDKGLIDQDTFQISTDRALNYIARGGIGPLGGTGGLGLSGEDRLEITRHNKMYQDYAARMLERGRIDNAINGLRPQQQETGAGRLNLDINVRGQPGVEVNPSISEGNLMSDEDTKVSREIVQ